jgi:NodT family efflux transporter outer membrane factor (OMF) lipoprotein
MSLFNRMDSPSPAKSKDLLRKSKILLPLPLSGERGLRWAVFLALILTACTVGPNYKRPTVETPAAYKEQAGTDRTREWKQATPLDAANRGPWWEVYNDPLLNSLEAQIDVSNQNLKAAEAAYRAAREIVAETNATLFPTLALDSSTTRSGTGKPNVPMTKQYSASLGASWAPDIWGNIRRTLEGDVASAQASAADLASARLSAQSDLATNYFNLRAQDSLKQLLDTTVEALERSLKIVRDQYNAGVAARADVAAAETQLGNAKAQAINAGVRRAQFEHALATLIGKQPAEFSIPVGGLAGSVPVLPVDVPSVLLERRPDIASAERLMASANAQIGVQTAAFFPNLTLSGTGGLTGMALSKLFQASNSFWTVGAAVAETIFDAGARSARVAQAEAGYDQSVANYRQTVLTAFQQVEDQLAALRILAEQAQAEADVVASAHEAERLALNQYKAGIVPYSNVITAQTVTLSNEQNALTVQQNRFLASVSLIGALGGGWKASELPGRDAIEPGVF